MCSPLQAPPDSPAPVDLDLDKVLGKMPDKDFKFKNFATQSGPLSLPSETAAGAALERVLRRVLGQLSRVTSMASWFAREKNRCGHVRA